MPEANQPTNQRTNEPAEGPPIGRDGLTGLYDAAGFLLLAEHQVLIARRTGESMMLLCCDVDSMSVINKAFGRAGGDAALIEAARSIRRTYREADVIGRTGPDEFAILAIGADLPHQDMLIGRLQDSLTGDASEASGPYELSVSVGAAHWDPTDACSAAELLEEARERVGDDVPER